MAVVWKCFWFISAQFKCVCMCVCVSFGYCCNSSSCVNSFIIWLSEAHFGGGFHFCVKPTPLFSSHFFFRLFSFFLNLKPHYFFSVVFSLSISAAEHPHLILSAILFLHMRLHSCVCCVCVCARMRLRMNYAVHEMWIWYTMHYIKHFKMLLTQIKFC